MIQRIATVAKALTVSSVCSWAFRGLLSVLFCQSGPFCSPVSVCHVCLLSLLTAVDLWFFATGGWGRIDGCDVKALTLFAIQQDISQPVNSSRTPSLLLLTGLFSCGAQMSWSGNGLKAPHAALSAWYTSVHFWAWTPQRLALFMINVCSFRGVYSDYEH